MHFGFLELTLQVGSFDIKGAEAQRRFLLFSRVIVISHDRGGMLDLNVLGQTFSHEIGMVVGSRTKLNDDLPTGH